MRLNPATRWGKWCVGLNTIFLIGMVTSILVFNVIGGLSFDNTWWDITAVLFLASVGAFFVGIVAVGKFRERSLLVYLSLLVSVCVILFVLLHSLFISD